MTVPVAPRTAVDLVDLSHVLEPGIPLGGPLPEVEVRPLWRLGEAIANISFCSFATHSGTHLDAPVHFIEGGRRLAEIDLEWLCGPASVVHVPRGEHGSVDAVDLDRAGAHVRAGDRVLLRTGFSDRYADPSYHRHPYLTEAAARWLVDRGVRLVAVDLLTPEQPRTLRIDEGFGFPVHHVLLGGEVLIVENARLPADLPARLDLMVLPLPISAGDGAPVRMVGRLPGSETAS
ncbi:cyclase family protein [Pseudonocardia xishanensis]|uniref:Cyclase family protein n=1 Tax=Pseudonocardia xishanensis TaxID=630995 RepID=A0ABP8RKB2_9PSEU